MKTKTGVLVFLALALFAAGEPRARAFTLERELGITNIGWSSRSLTIDYDSSQCPDVAGQFTDAIDAAIAMWNGAPSTNMVLTKGSSVTLPFGIDDFGRVNPTIICSVDFTEQTSDSSDAALGATAITISQANGAIVSATTYLNNTPGATANVFTAYSAADLQATVAHELGHAMGLGHSADQSALMFALGSGPVLGLAQDDIDGISWLYPREEPGQGKYFGCGTIERPGSGPGAGGGFFGSGPIGNRTGERLRGDEASPSNSAAATEFCLLLAFAAAARLVMRLSGRRLGVVIQ